MGFHIRFDMTIVSVPHQIRMTFGLCQSGNMTLPLAACAGPALGVGSLLEGFPHDLTALNSKENPSDFSDGFPRVLRPGKGSQARS